MLSSENQFLFGVGFKFVQDKGITDHSHDIQTNLESSDAKQ
jgi:hypothetical protein